MKFLTIIPTYNEVENIEPLVHALFGQIPQDAGILVVDDNSPDRTAETVENLIPRYPRRLHLLKRPGKKGLAQAYIAAFEWGITRGYELFLEMDADFSHNPAYIPGMLKAIQTHDAVIGSRNIKGGAVEGWSFCRTVLSKGGSLYARMILGCPVKDLTGGFNMWTKNALKQISLNRIVSKGYLFQVEMKYRAHIAGCSIKEIPILFSDRKYGISKMSKKIFLEALLNIWKIKKAAGKDTALDQSIKFFVTGGLGTITNLIIFFLCTDLAGLPEIPVSIACFFIAASQNYVINHSWSFRASKEKTVLSVTKWGAFLCVSLLGLGVNIAVLNFVFAYFSLPYKFIAQIFGITAGMGVNFAVSKMVVFRRE
ncbi:MAG: glycosyltransferase family 2 protein [Treponema sp.]|jgi:dolichol-phosphate mannosyltransferase|nr:glycosyltransferase family 2 protein [Treponema sp.]